MKYQQKTLQFDLIGWRKSMDLSCRELAKIVGCDYSYLYRLERGQYIASYKMAKKIFYQMHKWQFQNNKAQGLMEKIEDELDYPRYALPPNWRG